MCFYIHPRYPNTLIAKKDIICYKAVKPTGNPKKYHPPVFSAVIYQLKALYTTRLNATRFYDHPIISRGFHSYSVKRIAIRRWPSVHHTIIQCIIPKGAKYYYNPDFKEYVSNQIKLVKIITTN